MHRRLSIALRASALFATALALSACGDDESPATDTAADAGDASDAATDAVSDAVSDAGLDTSDATADTPAVPDATADASPEIGPDGFPLCNTDAASDDVLTQGDYFMSLSIAPLGGLLINFRVHLVASTTEVLEFEIWSLSPDLTWESPQATGRFCNLPISDGNFELAFDVITIPPQGTTTGVEVDVVDGVFNATILDGTTFCGDATGSVPLLRFDIDGSTFRGVPFGEQTNPPAAACEVLEPTRYAPIETCPALVAGANDLVSAELDRDLILVVPEGIETADSVPVVFLFHGLGDRASAILDYSGMRDVAMAEGFLLVAPNGARTSAGAQVFPVDWNSLASQFEDDNQDLVFFDDVLHCLSEQYPVDPDRVYVTGMSGGGLWSTYVGLHRSDVVAAAAPFSGGYLLGFPEGRRQVPYMVSWGGPDDIAVDTDFNASALNLIANLLADDRFVVACDHDQAHTWPAEMTPAVWPFLSAFRLGDIDNPFADGLPDTFPDYCEIR